MAAENVVFFTKRSIVIKLPAKRSRYVPKKISQKIDVIEAMQTTLQPYAGNFLIRM